MVRLLFLMAIWLVGCGTMFRSNTKPSSVDRASPFVVLYSTRTSDGQCIDYDQNHASVQAEAKKDPTYSSQPCPIENATCRCSLHFERGDLSRSVVSYSMNVVAAQEACNAASSTQAVEISGPVSVQFVSFF